MFGDCLHKYVITDAIKDENVLKFSVEYVGRYKRKETATEIDIEVEDIDTKELMEDDKRLEKIADYIIANHNRKTHSKDFTAMFCVNSVQPDQVLWIFSNGKKKKENTILKLQPFSAMELMKMMQMPMVLSILKKTFDNVDLNDVAEESPDVHKSMHHREKLDEYIGDYNQMFGTNFQHQRQSNFYNYYNDISKKVKERKIDILLVVNMFLTGFDSPTLNTLYVDKNLKYHGLIQAYSRTNRIINEQKSQGNIVVFRNLKQVPMKPLHCLAIKKLLK